MREPSQPFSWEYHFAWIRIFRSFRIALDIRKILLGAVAILLLMGFDHAIEHWTADPDAHALLSGSKEKITEIQESPGASLTQIPDKIDIRISPQNNKLIPNQSGKISLVEPLNSFLDPLGQIILMPKNWKETAIAWTKLLFSLFVWSFFGLAITRMAAIQFARQEKIGLRAGLRFSTEKFLATVAAPIIPICGIGLFWFLGTIGGWIGLIPGVGELILGILWILPLFFGFVTSLILIGLCLGWPMMVTAIASEGSDGFDGFSRAFSYLYSKPWHFAWYTLVTLVYGFITISIFYVFISSCSFLASRMVETSNEMGISETASSFETFVMQSWNSQSVPVAFPEESASSPGKTLINYWNKALSLICSGFAVSFFWTGATAVYFLIRRADDATDFNEVYYPKEDSDDDLLPLVGIADSEQPTTERPVDGIKEPEPPEGVQDPQDKEKPEEE